MHWIDWAILGLYGVLVIGIGTIISLRQEDTDEYFRGSRELPWWAIGVSILVTAFSASSMLGGPGEGFEHGFLWLQLQIGDLVGFVLVCVLFLPVLVSLDITTAYEYLEQRFDQKTRWLGSGFFVLFVLVRLGALLYGMSLLFAQITGWPIELVIWIVGVISILYTVAGGISAVVWTDVLQFVLILIGVSTSIFVIVNGVDGGLSAVWRQASEAGRTDLFSTEWDPTSIRTLPTVIFGYAFFAFSVAGTNQQSVQRYVSCRNVKESVKATLLGWFSGFVAMSVTLTLGVFLFAYYTSNAAELPAGYGPDEVFPYFIHHDLPTGVTGILVCAVFAAAMSSIDSALHSLSTTAVVDFLRPLRHIWYERKEDPADREITLGDPEDIRDLRISRLLVVLFGIIGIGAGIYTAAQEETLLEYIVKYTAYFLGPLLGLFLLGMLSRRAEGSGAFWGTLLAAGSMLIIATTWSDIVALYRNIPVLGGLLDNFGDRLPSIWQPVISAPLTFVFGYLISLRYEPPTSSELTGLIRFDVLPPIID